MRSRLSVLIAAAVLLALSLPVVAVARSGASSAQAEHARIVAYWTPARIASAVPRDYIRDSSGRLVPNARPPGAGGGGGGGGDGGAVTGASWTGNGAIELRSGRILFSMGGSNWICSGSVIADDGTGNDFSTVLTAGHCVYDGGDGWATNWMFIPDFDDGPTYTCAQAALGCWTATRLAAHADFVSGGGFGNDTVHVDYAFARVGLGGKGDVGTLELDALPGGSYTLKTSTTQLSDTQWAFGYPAAGKYRGNDLVYCKGSLIADPYGSDTWGMACKMTGGSSGGPWLHGTTNPADGSGVVSSVNSYGYSGLAYMFGPKFTGATSTVLGDVIDGDATGGVSAVQNRPAPLARSMTPNGRTREGPAVSVPSRAATAREAVQVYPRFVRPLPAPFDRLAAGLPADIAIAGSELLNHRLLTKEHAFPLDERTAFGLHGILPDRVLSIEEQIALEHEHLNRKSDDLERYIGLAALQDRNATLFYRLLAEHIEEYLPVVYTPTVGRACQEFSHIVRRTRGVWLTPADRDRIPEVLRAAPFEDVRLIVVTDNERILGLGDLGAGGMAIPIGKLALYTAACGIHPVVTLPVSLDVGTDNRSLLDDPLYLGFRAPRLRGAAYDAFIEAFVNGVHQVWPDCLIQFEDFKQHNAIRLLDRYRRRIPCFNDDIQGTAAVVVGGLIAGLRLLEATWADQRVVLAGAGAAGTGIARLLRLAMIEDGMSEADARRAIALVDSEGLVYEGRANLDLDKQDTAYSAAAATEARLVLASHGREEHPGLLEVVRALSPTILIGTTGHAGSFSEELIRAMAQGTDRPIVMPLSNPTANTEALPADILAWTDGRALVATGSPFPAVELDGSRREIGQANNVFVFPGMGLGAIVSEAREVTDAMFLAAAETVADHVSPERLAAGALYPSVTDLRVVSRRIAIRVAAEAIRSGLSPLPPDTDVTALVDSAIWWPAYAPYHRPGFEPRHTSEGDDY